LRGTGVSGRWHGSVIHDTDGRETMAFTAFGIETLKELIADQPEAES
jgi:hypothetical protein